MVDTPGGSVSQRPFANPASISSNATANSGSNNIALPSVIESSGNAGTSLRDRLFPSNQGIAPLPSLGSTSNKPDSSSNAMVAIGASGTTVPLPSLATSTSSGERNELTRLPSFQHAVSGNFQKSSTWGMSH